MVWFWSDDLARELLECGIVEPDSVRGWLSKPLAFAAIAEEDAASVGRRLLGLEKAKGAA